MSISSLSGRLSIAGGQALRRSHAGDCRAESRALGHEGRIALHALPTSERFYAKLGLGDFGPDPEENGLRYSELAPGVLESGE
jgi:hypothetical protein